MPPGVPPVRRESLRLIERKRTLEQPAATSTAKRRRQDDTDSLASVHASDNEDEYVTKAVNRKTLLQGDTTPKEKLQTRARAKFKKVRTQPVEQTTETIEEMTGLPLVLSRSRHDSFSSTVSLPSVHDSDAEQEYVGKVKNRDVSKRGSYLPGEEREKLITATARKRFHNFHTTKIAEAKQKWEEATELYKARRASQNLKPQAAKKAKKTQQPSGNKPIENASRQGQGNWYDSVMLSRETSKVFPYKAEASGKKVSLTSKQYNALFVSAPVGKKIPRTELIKKFSEKLGLTIPRGALIPSSKRLTPPNSPGTLPAIHEPIAEAAFPSFNLDDLNNLFAQQNNEWLAPAHTVSPQQNDLLAIPFIPHIQPPSSVHASVANASHYNLDFFPLETLSNSELTPAGGTSFQWGNSVLNTPQLSAPPTPIAQLPVNASELTSPDQLTLRRNEFGQNHIGYPNQQPYLLGYDKKEIPLPLSHYNGLFATGSSGRQGLREKVKRDLKCNLPVEFILPRSRRLTPEPDRQW